MSISSLCELLEGGIRTHHLRVATMLNLPEGADQEAFLQGFPEVAHHLTRLIQRNKNLYIISLKGTTISPLALGSRLSDLKGVKAYGRAKLDDSHRWWPLRQQALEL